MTHKILNRVILPVRRYKQRQHECAVATVASIANFYDKSVTYNQVREMIPKNIRKEGLYTSQQGMLFNKLGFGKVTIVTYDLNTFDFSWNNLSNKRVIRRLKKVRRYHARDKEEPYYMSSSYIKWLSITGCDNRIIVDNDLPKYIKRDINNGRPVAASYNYTSLMKCSKGSLARDGDVKGEILEHAIVIRGYDDKGIFVVDSEDNYGSLGRYKLKWTDFLLNVSQGDLILIG